MWHHSSICPYYHQLVSETLRIEDVWLGKTNVVMMQGPDSQDHSPAGGDPLAVDYIVYELQLSF